MSDTMIGVKLEEETKYLSKMCERIGEAINYELDKGIEQADAKELGEAVDMLKDLYEAKEKMIKGCYYKYIMEAMEKGEEEEGEGEEKRYYRGQPRSKTTGRYMRRGRRGYEEMMPDEDWEEMERMRDMDKETMDRMYYSEGMQGGYSSSSGMGGQSYSGNSGGQRDYREGRSGQSRRGYMEAKETHGNSPEDKKMKMQELEKYMQELSGDITEMIGDASPEEKNLLRNKLQTLTSKIN